MCPLCNIRVKTATKGKSSILVITFNRIKGDSELLFMYFENGNNTAIMGHLFGSHERNASWDDDIKHIDRCYIDL